MGHLKMATDLTAGNDPRLSVTLRSLRTWTYSLPSMVTVMLGR